jgi:hypothetical protein
MLTRDILDSVHILFDNDLPFEIIRSVLSKYRRTMTPDAYHHVNRALQAVENKIGAYDPKCFDRNLLSLSL